MFFFLSCFLSISRCAYIDEQIAAIALANAECASIDSARSIFQQKGLVRFDDFIANDKLRRPFRFLPIEHVPTTDHADSIAARSIEISADLWKRIFAQDLSMWGQLRLVSKSWNQMCEQLASFAFNCPSQNTYSLISRIYPESLYPMSRFKLCKDCFFGRKWFAGMSEDNRAQLIARMCQKRPDVTEYVQRLLSCRDSFLHVREDILQFSKRVPFKILMDKYGILKYLQDFYEHSMSSKVHKSISSLPMNTLIAAQEISFLRGRSQKLVIAWAVLISFFFGYQVSADRLQNFSSSVYYLILFFYLHIAASHFSMTAIRYGTDLSAKLSKYIALFIVSLVAESVANSTGNGSIFELESDNITILMCLAATSVLVEGLSARTWSFNDIVSSIADY